MLIETGSYYEPKPASNSRSSHVNCDNGKQAPPCQVTLNSFGSIYYFMSVLPACMSMYHMSIWCPQRSEESVKAPGSVLQEIVSHHVGTGNRILVLCKSRRLSRTTLPVL